MIYNTVFNEYSIVIDDIRNEIIINDTFVCKLKKKRYINVLKIIIDTLMLNSFWNYAFSIKTETTGLKDNYISLSFDPDVGRCFDIILYRKNIFNSQKFYYNNVTFSYTHYFLNENKSQFKTN